MPLRASCQCKGVVCEIDAIDGDLWNCHCQTCRKSHAAERNTAARVKREHFRVVKGADQLTGFESMPGKFRRFCSVCGSHVYAERLELPFVVLRTGVLDDDPGVKPAMDVWTSHARPWLAHQEGLPAYLEAPPAA
jgi:hypothetical protein